MVTDRTKTSTERKALVSNGKVKAEQPIAPKQASTSSRAKAVEDSSSDFVSV
jgi:putative membrane protein